MDKKKNEKVNEDNKDGKFDMNQKDGTKGAEEAKSYEFVADKESGKAQTEESQVAAAAQFLRLQADFENFKKRNQATSVKRYNDGVEEVLKAVLPTIDYLDLAIAAQVDEAQRKGIELVKKNFVEVLNKYNVTEIAVLGLEFNPMNAEAVMSKEDAENCGKVINVLKKGYARGEIILRHAMVVVGA